MSKTTTGIEIDGAHVRVARVDGTRVSYQEFEGDTAADAVDAWLKAARPKGDYVLTWSGRSVLREATVPACPDSVLPAVFMDTAPDVMSTDGYVVGGVISGDPAADGTRPALLGAVEADQLSGIFRKLGKTTPVLISTFAYTQDGIYLAVRAGNVEMTLVKDGRVVASRFLSIDGIDVLSASLNSGGDTRQKIEAYGDNLVNEIRETQRTWSRSDRFDATATTVFIHGLGADLPRLREKITATTGLRCVEPAAPGVDTGSMNGQAHKAYQALVAATAGAAERPGILLRSPSAERAAKEKASKEKRRSVVTLGIVAAAVLVVLATAPIVLAQRNLAQAEDRYNSAVTEFNGLRAFDILGHESRAFERASGEVDGNEPNWPAILFYLQEQAPAGTTFSDLRARTATNRQVQVEISAQITAGPFDGPAEWIRSLLEEEGIPYAWIESSALSDESSGIVSAVITMLLPDDTRFFYLSDNEYPPPTGDVSPEPTDAAPAEGEED